MGGDRERGSCGAASCTRSGEAAEATRPPSPFCRVPEARSAAHNRCSDSERSSGICKAAGHSVAGGNSAANNDKGARAESIQAQLKAQQQKHEPLLFVLQESACRYAAALSAKAEKLRAEELHAEDLARQQRAEAGKLRDSATKQDIEAAGYDTQAKQTTKELSAVRQLHKHLEDQGILQAGERGADARYRWQQQQVGQQKGLQTIQAVLEALELEQQEASGATAHIEKYA